jgi:uncharacterized membrane protein YqjE
VRSRSGNRALAILGALYALSSSIVLIWFVADVWRAAAVVDLLLQLAVAASAAGGVWFYTIARDNLGIQHRHQAVHK